MTKIEIQVQNLKCGGCANTIENKLEQIKGIDDIEVYAESDLVCFEYETEESLEQAKKTLLKIGYPEVGAENSLGTKIKSFGSCAIGRLND